MVCLSLQVDCPGGPEIINEVDQICCIVGGHDPVKVRGKLVEDVRS